MILCIITTHKCAWVVNIINKKVFYIVDAEALPDVFRKVIEAKDCIDNGTAKNISEAIKICDISRSAFYKYRDNVFKLKDKDEKLAEIQAILLDRAGVFSALSSELSRNGANIITMNQTAPQNGMATVTIAFSIDGLSMPIEHLVDLLEQINGVVSVKIK